MIVSDAGPIISFARAGYLHLLKEVFKEILIPEAVYNEIVTEKGRAGEEDVKKAKWIKKVSVKDKRKVKELSERLGLGESEAIVLAIELSATLLVDDYKARREAEKLGVKYVGSLWVLKEAKSRGILKEVKPVLDKLIASGFRIKSELYQEFLKIMDEL